MDTYPSICHDVGLDCETCTESTARNLAKVCRGLRGKMIGQLFVQIYTNSACSKMHGHFAEAYLEASGEGLLAIAAGVRKPPRFETHTAAPAKRTAAMVAVAAVA